MELAMTCDIIYAAKSAKFGQPEIKLGTLPGGGGTQRLARLVGKQRAMELVLTGQQISAQEAMQMGIVCRIFEDQDLLSKTKEMAASMALYSSLALSLAKEAVNKSQEMTLQAGLDYERSLFHSSFALVSPHHAYDVIPL